jgi:mRNA interferase MazF
MVERILRGDVVLVNLDPTVGTEIQKTRPCVIVQNDTGNRVAPRTIIVPLTGAEHIDKPFPLHVIIPPGEGGTSKQSVVLCDQIRVVDKSRIVKPLGHLSAASMKKVDAALKISLGLK